MSARAAALVAAAIVAGALAASCDRGHDAHEHEHAAAPAAAPAPSGSAANVVQREMRLLRDAMQESVAAIAGGDVRGVPAALHRVHAAKESTAAALRDGSWRPPKNGDRVARFVELDEAAHHDLEALVEAASRNDVDATAAAVGKALGRCNGCHVEFRR